MNLFTLLLTFISFTSITSMLQVSFKAFSPVIAVLTGIVATLIFSTKHKLDINKPVIDWKFSLIILLALIFRFKAFDYVLAGQDPGTYTNMAKKLVEQGSMTFTDYERETLTKGQQALYDQTGDYLFPGFHIKDRGNSTYIMRFYPLLPMWLAISKYSLLIFSLISIGALSLLAYEISGRKKAPMYLTALFLAINPLHVFFSKMPASEMVALAFTSSSFYLLVKYLNDFKNKKNNVFNLELSALLMTGFYYTRMSSFLYIPFFILCVIAILVYLKKSNFKKSLLIYFAVLGVLFLVSYAYYYFVQFELFYLTYKTYILSYTNSNTALKLLLAGFAGLVFLIGIHLTAGTKWFSKVKTKLEPYLKYVLLAFLGFVLIIGAKKAISFANPNNLYEGSVYSTRWEIEGQGIKSIKNSYLYVSILYLTPILLGVFIYSLFKLDKFKKINKPAFIFICIFILEFLFLSVYRLGPFKYHYYYGRYLLSEVIPYTIVISSIGLAFIIKNNKKLGVALALAFVLLMLPYSRLLQKGEEGIDTNFYKQIKNDIPIDALVLVITEPEDKKVEMEYEDYYKYQKYVNNYTKYVFATLKHTYNYNVILLPNEADLKSPEIITLTNRYKNTYLVSDQKIGIRGFEFIRALTSKYSYYSLPENCSKHTYSFLDLDEDKGKLESCFTLPSHYFTRSKDYYLYKIKRVFD